MIQSEVIILYFFSQFQQNIICATADLKKGSAVKIFKIHKTIKLPNFKLKLPTFLKFAFDKFGTALSRTKTFAAIEIDDWKQ